VGRRVVVSELSDSGTAALVIGYLTQVLDQVSEKDMVTVLREQAEPVAKWEAGSPDMAPIPQRSSRPGDPGRSSMSRHG
jgi:hypothetical protein